MKNNIKRLDWIDLVKGIGILLVLAGHSNFIPLLIKCYIYSFHMPLFFILSGYTFKYKDKISKNIKKLIIPYIFFFLLLFIIIVIENNIFTTKINLNLILGLLFQRTGYIYSIWFLLSLAFTEIIYNKIIKISRDNPKTITYITITIIIFSCYYFTFVKEILPLQLQTLFTLLPMFSIGYMIKKNNLIEKISQKKIIIVNTLISFILFFIKIKYTKSYTSITSNEYGNILIYYLLAIITSFMIIGVCTKIKNIKIINYIGKNSLVYFGMQQSIILIPFQYMVKKYGIDINITRVFTKLFATSISLLLNVLILTIVSVIFNKTKLKKLIGK